MRVALSVLGAVHLIVAVWHGNAHADLGVGLSAAQNLFVYVVIVLAPLVAVCLLWTRYERQGLWLFLIALVGAFLFGAYYHYVCVSPDNIHHLPPGSADAHERFVRSAAVLAVVELAAAVCGAVALARGRDASGARVIPTRR